LLVAVIVPLWLAACATQPPPELAAEDQLAKQFVPDSENGTIYLYRKSFLGFIGSTAENAFQVRFPMYFDGQPIGHLKIKEFVRLSAPPGPHDIMVMNTASRRPARITLEVETGKLYFVEIVVQAPLDSYPVRLVAVDERTGKSAILDGTVIIVEKAPSLLQ
jgi:hypothetical protein